MEILDNPWPTPFAPSVQRGIFPPLKLKGSKGTHSFESGSPLSMYVCGITPYDATHLGHAATYLTFDLINRYKRAAGDIVNFVENITDVDEPLFERAHRDSLDWRELGQSQTDLYRNDMTALRIFPPKYFVPVTQVMPLIDEAISSIVKNGYAYKVENDLYFRTREFLADLPVSESDAHEIFGQRGGDPERAGKEHPLDPVLWIANKENEPGWQSSHGFGRPGWHVECCVISLRYLVGVNFLQGNESGETLIDIQGGGSDLIFPHHFMSAAQSKAMTGQEFARAFVHTGMIGLDGEKMSKSKGNLVFVSKLLDQGIDPVVIRFALLQGHYSQDRMWSNEVLQTAIDDVQGIRTALAMMEVPSTDSLVTTLIEGLADDLDTSRFFTALKTWVNDCHKGLHGGSAGELSRAMDSLLGLAF
jgi:L-cysteine:1D-myo-inositol 2-amino-2-deoxy-alpha-D-glucopyranoside ligase